MRGRAAAWLIAVAICAGLYATTWRPLTAQAVTVPGFIYPNAGSVGTGLATSLGQQPYSFAVAGTHLYIGDGANPVVRDVDTVSGQESVFAGNDGYGYKGDGGPAVSAMIGGAWAMARCGGDTFFADTMNYVIRKIDYAGTITTVVGNGKRGYSGDGLPGTSASIGRVFGMACPWRGAGPDTPFLYFTDSTNGVLRAMTGSGLVYTLLTGMVYPTGVMFDAAGNLYISETGTDMVWRGDAITRVVSAFAGNGSYTFSGDGGPATSASLASPWGLAYTSNFTPFGNSCPCYVTIADRDNNRIRMVNTTNGVIDTLAGNGMPGFAGDGSVVDKTTTKLNSPLGLGYNIDNKLVYVADSGNNRARKIDMTSRIISTIAGNGTPSLSGDGGPATAAQLGNPYSVAVDGAGDEYIADNQNNVIRKIDHITGNITRVAGSLNATAGYSGDGGLATSAYLNDPRGVAVTPSGDMAISDTGNQRVRWVDHLTGTITTIAGTGVAGSDGDGVATGRMLNYPRGLAIDAGGKVYIADTDNNRVRVVDRGANTISAYAGTGLVAYGGDGGPALNAWLNSPRGLALDGAGNLYISDGNNNRVRKVATGTGIITTVAGNGTAGLAGDTNLATSAALDHPFGLAIDASGNLFIADTRNQRIRLVDTKGIISSVVGTCGNAPGFSGDNGPASFAELNFPYGLAVNSGGDLFIADVNNNRVRQAVRLAAGRPGTCQSTSVTPPSRDSTLPGPGSGQPPGRLTPIFDRPETARSSTAPATPAVVGSASFVWAAPTATQPAAAAPAAIPPAVAAPVAAPSAAAPAVAPPAVAPEVEVAPAINSREVAEVVTSRNPDVSRNVSGRPYGPAVLISLALISLALLGVRRRKNARLNGHKRPLTY